jgi:hypothetical protein
MTDKIFPQKSVNSDEPQVKDPSVKLSEDEFKWNSGGMNEKNLKGIVLMHIRKISELSCQELTPSYFIRKPVKTGDGIVMVETYMPDLRLAYCNAVDFLTDIVMPEADNKFKEFINDKMHKEELEFKEFREKGFSQDSWILRKLEYRRKIFAEIMILIYRIDYFSEEDIYVE